MDARAHLTLLVPAIAVALVVGATVPATAGSRVLVRMIDFGYRPSTVSGLTTNPLDPAHDHPIVWRNDGSALHDVREPSGQQGIRVRAPALSAGESSSGFRLRNAASYRYYCTYHPSMKGRIKIKPALYRSGNPGNYAIAQGPNGTAIVRLGFEPLPRNQVMDVQRRKDSGRWTLFKTTRSRLLKVSPNADGTYRFRARIRQTAKDTTTGWSPATKPLTVR